MLTGLRIGGRPASDSNPDNPNNPGMVIEDVCVVTPSNNPKRGGVNSAPFTCQICTFENEKGGRSCEICGTPRPRI